MANQKPLVLDSGTTQQLPNTDTLLAGVAIEPSTGTALRIGTVGGTTVTTFPGPVRLDGDVTTVGGTTFTTDATFEGNVTFGNGPADTVAFAASTTVVSNINFATPVAYKITNLANGTNPNDAVNLSQLSGFVTSVGASAPLASSGGTTPSISLTGTVPVANGGTGTSTAFTAGSVVFAGASGVYTQDNANLFFDDANNRLGIGTATPNERLTVNGALSIAEGTAPSLTAGFGKFYALSTDSRPYFLDDGGQAYNLTLDRFNTLTPAASVAIDTNPSLPVFNSLAISQNTTFTTSNLGNGRSASIRISNATASSYTLTWPGTWTWLGTGAPTSIAANTTGYLSITAYGATDANVVAAWSFSGTPAAVTGLGAATRVAFWSGTSSLASNGNLYWDNTNSRLGVGTTTPASLIQAQGSGDVEWMRVGTTATGGGTCDFYASGTGPMNFQGPSGGVNTSSTGFPFKINIGNTNVATFGSTIATFNEPGNDCDLRVESVGNANMLFVDAGANRVGIGTGTPAATLHTVGGLLQTGGAVSLTGNAASDFTTSTGALTLTSAAGATWSTSAGTLSVRGASQLLLSSSTGSAGPVTVSVGSQSTLNGNGGQLTLTAGGANGTGTGGDVWINPGDTSTGTNGRVRIANNVTGQKEVILGSDTRLGMSMSNMSSLPKQAVAVYANPTDAVGGGVGVFPLANPTYWNPASGFGSAIFTGFVAAGLSDPVNDKMTGIITADVSNPKTSNALSSAWFMQALDGTANATRNKAYIGHRYTGTAGDGFIQFAVAGANQDATTASVQFNMRSTGAFEAPGDARINNITVGRGNTSAPATSTAFGVSALSGSTGADNTALGNTAGSTVTSGSNLTLVGSNAQPSSATATNEITFGNSSVTAFRFGTASTTAPNPGISANLLTTLAELNIGHNANSGSAPFVSFFIAGGNGTGAAITQAGGGGFGVLYTTGSDYRLKQDVEELVTTDALERLVQLRPVKFRYTMQPDGPLVDGFLAHEAQAVVPQAVTHYKDAVDGEGNPKYQGIDHGQLVPLIAAATKELAAKAAAAEARANAAEARLAALEETVLELLGR